MQSPSHKLSVCIPAYNRPEWLQRAISSVTNAPKFTISALELIISDDSTNPACGEIAQKLLFEWGGSYRYIHNNSSLGMAENWNQSIQLASGQYVMLLHDDDFLLEGSVVKILEAITDSQQSSPVLLFGVKVVNENQRLLKLQLPKRQQWLSPQQALIKLLSNSSYIRFPAIVIQRNMFDHVGYFNPRWGGPADIDMWLRLLSQFGVHEVPQTISAYTVHSQALTMAMFNKETIHKLITIFNQASMLKILKKQDLERCKSNYFHQFVLAGTFRFLRRGRRQEARKVMELFKIKELENLRRSQKWTLIYYVFQLILIK